MISICCNGILLDLWMVVMVDSKNSALSWRSGGYKGHLHWEGVLILRFRERMEAIAKEVTSSLNLQICCSD